jgi:hypothetical protein
MGCSSSMLHQADVMWTSVRRVQPRTVQENVPEPSPQRTERQTATARAVLGVRLVRPPDNIRRAPDRTRVTLLPAHPFDKCQLDISQLSLLTRQRHILCSAAVPSLHAYTPSHFFALFSASAAFLRAVFLEAFSACVWGSNQKGPQGRHQSSSGAIS